MAGGKGRCNTKPTQTHLSKVEHTLVIQSVLDWLVWGPVGEADLGLVNPTEDGGFHTATYQSNPHREILAI